MTRVSTAEIEAALGNSGYTPQVLTDPRTWWQRLLGVPDPRHAGCMVCGFAEDETDLDLYYRYGFWHQGGTAYAAPGSEAYEQRKAGHTHA